MINPKIIAQKTPQTTIKTIPTTINIGTEILIFPFGGFEAGCAVFVGVGVGVGVAVPLKENVFPSVIGLAGVLVRASSAVPGIEGIVGASTEGGVIGCTEGEVSTTGVVGITGEVGTTVGVWEGGGVIEGI